MKARFTTDQRHERWIKPLKELPRKRMPHDLFCFATRYLVEEARTRGVPNETLVQDLPDWLTIDYLTDTGKQVSHGVFIALAERLKEARNDPSPYNLRTAAYHTAQFEDWVTNLVRRGGSVGFAMWFTSFMGNLVTKDQQVNALETGRENGTRKGRTAHYFLRPEDETYLEQSTFTMGYYEVLTRLWKKTTDAPLVRVHHAASRFSPEKLLADEYAYAREGLGIGKIERNKIGHLLFDGEVVALAESVPVFMEKWALNPKHARKDARPVVMIRDLEYNGEVIFNRGQILDAPASVYEWEYEKLPPVTRLQAFIQGMHDRFFVSTKHLRASYERVSAERDRAEANLEEAVQQRAEAERQRALAEARSEELRQLISGKAHEDRNGLARMQSRALVLKEYLKSSGAPQERVDDAGLLALEARITLETSEGLRALFTSAEQRVERVDLVRVVSEYGTLFANDPKNRELEITFNPDDWYPVEVIKGTAYSLLANLFTNAANAMDYGARGKKLEISLRREQRGTVQGVAVTVADEGVGMDAERIRKYKAGELPAGGEERTGTGHKLVTRFAYEHNKQTDGKGLDVESVVGQGTRITVFIPESYQR